MKKHKRRKPSLFDRFCDKFGPAIIRGCRLIDKYTHNFFENLAWIMTSGAYQPQPYQEPEEIKKDNGYLAYQPKRSISASLMGDFRAVMGDMHQVEKDITKAAKKMEQENPNLAKAMQEARNSPTYQEQERKLRAQMAEVQQQCQQVRHVCSHPTTVNSGNTSQNERCE